MVKSYIYYTFCFCFLYPYGCRKQTLLNIRQSRSLGKIGYDVKLYRNVSMPKFDGLIPFLSVRYKQVHRTKDLCTLAMVISNCNSMVLDPTVVSFTKTMQFIPHNTNFPTASIDKITTFEKSVVVLNLLIYEKGKIPFSCSNSCSW